MNEDKGIDPRIGPDPSEDLIAALIRNAGPREAPPAAHYADVLTATRRSWRAKVATRRRRRRAWALAAGVAALALAATLGQRSGPVSDAGVVVAATDAIVGEVDVWRESRPEWMPLSDPGVAITPGTRVRTSPSASAGLILEDGTSLRIAGASEIAFKESGRLWLDDGAVYVDTGLGAHAARRVEIVTPAGVAWDLGTQFEIRYRDDLLTMRVREGRVVLERETEEIQGLAGEQLRLAGDGVLERSAISPFGPEWRWVQAVAPLPYGDTLTVHELLDWVSRETGREIHFSEPGLAVRASRTILHGNRHRLLPMEALAVMLATTDLGYTVTGDGEILITGEAR